MSDGHKIVAVLGASWVLALAGAGLTVATGERIYSEVAVVVLAVVLAVLLIRVVYLGWQLLVLHYDFREIGRSWEERNSNTPEAVARRERLRRKYGSP